jgi:hypothetical protein
LGLCWNPEDLGCTYTQGYWKNHPDAWPEGYDPDDRFYVSGMSWMQVFDTDPRPGNAYYILAHQYMAAVLNVASGAYVPAEIQQTLGDAEEWFADAKPGSCGGDACGVQKSWADLLDTENNGWFEGGPPLCEG